MSTRGVSGNEVAEAMEAMNTLMKRGGAGEQPLREAVKGDFEQAIEYTRVERQHYVGEVGKKNGQYIYHFWPRQASMAAVFGDKLGDAMLAVFKYSERVAAKHDEIMRCFEGEGSDPSIPLCRYWGQPSDFQNGQCPNCGSKNVQLTQSSWAVRVTGYADNPLADDLAGSVFDTLDRLL